MLGVWMLFFLLLGLASATGQGITHTQQDLLLRVLLSEDSAGKVQLGPHQRNTAFGSQDLGAGTVRLTAGLGEVLVDGQSAGPWVELAPAEGFALNGRLYRGNLLAVWRAGRIVFINRIWLEEYLLGVVPAEVPASFPDAVLQAQAILARTFALYRLNPQGLYDICATERCQVYLGRSVETTHHTSAVMATRSLIVSHDQNPITAVYHADSGGHTAASAEVWGRNRPYLVSRPDPFSTSPRSPWSRTLSPAAVAQGLLGLGIQLGTVQSMVPLLMSESGRPIRLRIVGSNRSIVLDGPQSTRLLRGLGLPSTRVQFDGWEVHGQGNGHGVGMSQWGARGLALQGWDFRQILGFYYPGTYLSRFEVVAGLHHRLRAAGFHPAQARVERAKGSVPLAFAANQPALFGLEGVYITPRCIIPHGISASVLEGLLHPPPPGWENPDQASIRLTLFEHIFKGMTLRQAVLAGLLALGMHSPALASGAQNLFDQATFLIGFYYHGPARVANFRELRRQYQPQLDLLCAAERERCGFDQARQVIVRILQDIADPFTVLMTRQQLIDDRRLGAGQGPAAPRIGVWVRETPRGLVVSEAFPGEPAFEAGLRRGDLITQVEGQPATLARLATTEASRTPFGLSYSRQGSLRSTVLAPRVAEVAMRPRLEVTAGIAYLRVYHLFSSEQFSTAEYIHQAARRAEEAGARGMIIDLRDALSGYDSEALLAAAAFTGKGGFIYDRRFLGLDETHTVKGGRLYVQPEGEQKEELSALQQPYLARLPVVVLVNRNTINSSEMLAYFLQAAGRAKVVGEPTAGALGVSGNAKGPLINGEFIMVSSLRMRHLDGSAFPLKVTPDLVVKDDLEALVAGRDLALERALDLLQ